MLGFVPLKTSKDLTVGKCVFRDGSKTKGKCYTDTSREMRTGHTLMYSFVYSGLNGPCPQQDWLEQNFFVVDVIRN